MPLKRGYSLQNIATNIKTLMQEGYPETQAAAIAYEIAKKALAKARKKQRADRKAAKTTKKRP